MRHDPKQSRLVRREFEALSAELIELRVAVDEARSARDIAPANSDPSWVFEQVTAAADAMVAAIEAWVPSLVPTPRALDEVLGAIASWQPSEHTMRAAKSARLLFEQLQAGFYGQSTFNPDEVPDLDEFIEDLGATLEAVERALS